eukprot:7846004-Pyramimonas_sp.AAC.1
MIYDRYVEHLKRARTAAPSQHEAHERSHTRRTQHAHRHMARIGPTVSAPFPGCSPPAPPGTQRRPPHPHPSPFPQRHRGQHERETGPPHPTQRSAQHARHPHQPHHTHQFPG